MKHKPIRILVVATLVGVGVAGRLVASRAAHDGALAATGTVEATEASLGFTVSGRITSVSVHEGDRVERGQVLATLDTTEIEARRAQARAQVDSARALLRELETGSRPEEVAQARAAVLSAREKVADAERDLDRTRRLFEGGAVSKEAQDKAALSVELDRSTQAQAAELRRLLEKGARVERIEAQRAQLAQAEAAVRALDSTLAEMTIHAPFAGVITVRHREPGEIVAPGAAVVTLTDRADRWVRIYVPENRLGAIDLGRPASITADTYAERVYPGEVSYIASEAEFTPKNVQTTEERVKLVYAVKVRVTGDPAYDLRPGLAADVRVQVKAQ